MDLSIPNILLWLFVLNLGIAVGAGLYEMRIIIPQWFERSNGAGLRVNSEAMRRTDPGLKFWGFVTTGPLTLLTIGNLIAAFGDTSLRHDWWVAAGLITLAERICTFAFFIPTAIKLSQPERQPASLASKMAARWVRLNFGRSALNLAGWLAALKAFSLPHL